MNKYETYISERLILINDEYKYTFLKCYGIDYKNNVDVVCQHLHTGDVKVMKMDVGQIRFHFNVYAGIIFSYLNKLIPTYKIK